MRIESKDLRHGLIRIRCENLDDLWYLSQVVLVGDLVRGKTQRRIKDKEDTKSSGGERKTITLTVGVEKAEFKSDEKVLRVSGLIVDCPDDTVACGGHHTFNIDSETVVTVIKKSWMKTDLERLSDAVKGTLRPKVVVVSLDEGEATVALFRESKPEFFEISANIGGKYDQKGREARKGEFYTGLAALLMNLLSRENVSHVILSGPGFEKGNFLAYLKEHDPVLAGKSLLEDTGQSGKAGVQEVLKREAIHKTLEEVNSVQDVRYLEDILRQIGKDTGLAAYGLREVKEAVDAGAVELFLVTDACFFQGRMRLEPLMNAVRHMNGKVHIINSDGEAGQKLASLGGVAIKLRYRLR
ncbi:MAG: mRNA surveillance protein pelota [Candidatus Altiarchaeota archaeon]